MNVTKHTAFGRGDNPETAAITITTPDGEWPETKTQLKATHNSTTAEKSITEHPDHIAPSDTTTDAAEIRRWVEQHANELSDDELRTALRILQLRAWVEEQPWLSFRHDAPHDRSGKHRFRPSRTETVTYRWVSGFGEGAEKTMTVHRNRSNESIRTELYNRKARHKIKHANDRSRSALKQTRAEEGSRAVVTSEIEILDRTNDAETLPGENMQTASPESTSSTGSVEQASLSDF